MSTTMKLIAKNTLGSSASSVTFSDIPATFTDLVLVVSGRSDRSLTFNNCFMTFNGSSTGYSYRSLYGLNGSAGSDSNTIDPGFQRIYITGANATSNTFGTSEAYISNYAGSTNKSVSITGVSEHNSANDAVVAVAAGLWSNTSAITSIGLTVAGGGNFVSGSSFYLYGITKA